MIRKQLSIFVENEPGVLARVTAALAQSGVNLRAVAVSDNSDDAVLRIVVDDDRKAIEILEQTAGALVVSREVVEVALPDTPGALAEVARALSERQINISYLYGSAGADPGGTAHIYLRVAGDALAADAAVRAHLGKH